MDIETTLNKCDFGEAIGDECHKLSYTRIQNMENLRCNVSRQTYKIGLKFY